MIESSMRENFWLNLVTLNKPSRFQGRDPEAYPMVYVSHQGWGALGWRGSTVLSWKGQISPPQQTAQ